MVEISEAAVTRIQNMLEQDNSSLFIRFGLKDGGCSGMTYGIVFDFTIQNPNAIATCGCGSSFRTALHRGKREKCE